MKIIMKSYSIPNEIWFQHEYLKKNGKQRSLVELVNQ